MTYDTMNNDVTVAGSGKTLLAGRYQVIRQLGTGGMGSVWLAEDAQLDGKLFAVKMLPSILVSNKRAYRQLKDEALVAMRLVHPNIVQIRAFEENNGNPFLVMDYIEGKTLDDCLEDWGSLSSDETAALLKPIAAALDYAHAQGVVHRDVKPANVMIRKDGTPFILDFGIAREMQETMTRVTGKLSSGTLLYMSPEQLNGMPPKPAQDIYSFAAMAYECIKGEPPFARGHIEHQILNNPPQPLPDGCTLSASILKGLSKTPEARPESCAKVLAPASASARRPKATAPAGQERRFSILSLMLLCVIPVIAALCGIGWYCGLWPRTTWQRHMDEIESAAQQMVDEARRIGSESDSAPAANPVQEEPPAPVEVAPKEQEKPVDEEPKGQEKPVQEVSVAPVVDKPREQEKLVEEQPKPTVPEVAEKTDEQPVNPDVVEGLPKQKVPVKQVPTRKPEMKPSASREIALFTDHVVQAGEELHKIAKFRGTTWKEIRDRNSSKIFDGGKVRVGTVLEVPLVDSDIGWNSLIKDYRAGSIFNIGGANVGGELYGDAHTEQSVCGALRWLKNCQNADGSWGAERKLNCTALSALAFLAHGAVPGMDDPSNEFGKPLNDGLDYLLKAVQNEFLDLYECGEEDREEAFLSATHALCEAYAVTKDLKYGKTAFACLRRIIKCQSAVGAENGSFAVKPSPGKDVVIFYGSTAHALSVLNFGRLVGLRPYMIDESIEKAKETFHDDATCEFIVNHGLVSDEDRRVLLPAARLALYVSGDESWRNALSPLADMREYSPSLDSLSELEAAYHMTFLKWSVAFSAANKASTEDWQTWNSEMKSLYSIRRIESQRRVKYANEREQKMFFWKVSDSDDDNIMGTCLAALQLMVYYRYPQAAYGIYAKPKPASKTVTERAGVSARSSAGTAPKVTSVPSNLGTVFRVDNEYKFAVLSCVAPDEIKLGCEYMVVRQDSSGRQEIVGRVRPRQRITGKPFWIFDIMPAWEVKPLQVGDVIMNLD